MLRTATTTQHNPEATRTGKQTFRGENPAAWKYQKSKEGAPDMSFVNKTKAFFGLGPYDAEGDEAYYDDSRYEGSVAYAPESRYEDRGYERSYSESRRYAAAIVPVVVERYGDATLIGNPVRDGDAVVFDIRNLSHSDAKRIIDFAAGICFGLRCEMKKLQAGVFCVVPKDADVSMHELQRVADGM